MCITNEIGFSEGLYEIVLEIEGIAMISDAVFVGGSRSLAEFTLSNQSSATLCDVFISPKDALNWGQDELNHEEIILPGETRVFNLATGIYNLRMLNCDGRTVLKDFELVVDEFFTYTMKD